MKSLIDVNPKLTSMRPFIPHVMSVSILRKIYKMSHKKKNAIGSAYFFSLLVLAGAANFLGAASADAAGIATDAAVASAASPAMLISFPGNNYTTNNTEKPDCSLAVGPTYIVTTEAARIQWYAKNGTLVHDQSMTSFFNIPQNSWVADAHVVYDTVNNRFVVASDQDVNGVNVIGLAVSKDSNPSDGWYFGSINGNLTINGTATWADFPGLATDGKAIYVTAIMRSFLPYGFPSALDTVIQSHLWIVNAGVGTGGFYDGGPLRVSDFGANTVTGGKYTYFGQPAQILSPTPGSLGTFLVNAAGTGGAIQVIQINNPTTSPSFHLQNVMGAVFSGSLQVQSSQPGTSATLRSAATGNSVWRNGTLYVVSTIVPTSGPDSGVPTAQWERINTSNLAALKLIDQGDISGAAMGAGAGVATFSPTISANAGGDFLVNFAASGPNLYVGSYYSLHAAEDASGTTETPQVLHAGADSFALTDSNGIVWWGDYSGGVDPATDTFWMFNEYAAQRSAGQTGNWATEIGEVAPQ